MKRQDTKDLNLIHIYQHYDKWLIRIKATPCDEEWISDEFDSEQDAIDEFNKQEYTKINDKFGKLDALECWELLFAELVPPSDNCDTVEGEMIRAIGKIEYRYYNDGDLFYQDYGIETAGGAAMFLKEHKTYNLDLDRAIDSIVEHQERDENYAQLVEEMKSCVLVHIIMKKGKYTPNTEDMFDYTQGAFKEWN